MVSYNGWLTHYYRLRKMEKRFTFSVISLQEIHSVSGPGVENSIRSLTG
jgi:hypothetical protein